MPAVTVSDLTVLPRVTAPGSGAVVRPVVSVTSAPSGVEGEGFPVKRAFAGVDLALLDPFIHMDEMGEVDYAPGSPRARRGTRTGVRDRHLHHRRHLRPPGQPRWRGSITDGDTQWMTAGSGLLHIEAPPEHLVVSGGLFHGFQLWVNLPRADKMKAPAYQDLRSGEVALATSADGGTLLRVIAGDVAGVTGPGSTHTPMAMVHASLVPGARLELPWRQDFNALAYVMGGRGTVGPSATPISAGSLAVLGRGDLLALTADTRQDQRYAGGLDVVILGGKPIREPLAWAARSS